MTIKKRTSTMNKDAAAKAAAVVKTAQRAIAAKTSKVPTKSKSLYFFQQTPMGGLLRAYFVAMIMVQCGGIKANVAFRLWPAANLNGHIKTKRLKRGKESGTYELTQAGVNYLTDEGNRPEKEMVDGMVKAVTKGERPAFYKKELSLING